MERPEFAALGGWQFPDAYIGRLLRQDIPQLMQYGNCQVWVYHDPAIPSLDPVGVGTLDLSDYYSRFTGGRPHPYLPVLSTRPGVVSRGYGEAIVRHLIAEAALLVRRAAEIDDRLFLDVYTDNAPAIRLYEVKCGFEYLDKDNPIPDPGEGGRLYHVMAKRVSIAPPT